MLTGIVRNGRNLILQGSLCRMGLLVSVRCDVCGISFSGEKANKVLNEWKNHYEPCYRQMEAWVKTRDVILKRDNNQCTLCGRRANLHVHHIHKKSLGGDNASANLITVCINCHSSIHNRKIPPQKIYESMKKIWASKHREDFDTKVIAS